jgi:hypothetical protein
MIRKIKATIAGLETAFRLFVDTVSTNTAAIERNTSAVASLTAEQKEIRNKLDELVDHARYVVKVKKSELQRAGHKTT